MSRLCRFSVFRYLVGHKLNKLPLKPAGDLRLLDYCDVLTQSAILSSQDQFHDFLRSYMVFELKRIYVA